MQASLRQGDTRGSRDLWSLGVLPVLALGALSGVLGVYWDIAWHTDIGRDSFFSPPHLFIYSAMMIVFLTGLYTPLRDRRRSPFHLRLGRFQVQPGVLIVALGSALTFLFAPADDLWHRLFGTEITLWAPMHLIGLLGLTTACFGGLIATRVEGQLAVTAGRKRLFGGLELFFAALLLAHFMLLLAEYEFGYPVFGVWLGVALLVGLPSFVFALSTRLSPFPWAASLTALGFTAFRLLLALWLMTSDRFFDWAGASRPLIPVLVLTGVAADLLEQRLKPWALGLSLGTITLLSTWGLTGLTGTMNWYPQALGVGAVVGLVLSVLTTYLGFAVADTLRPVRDRGRA